MSSFEETGLDPRLLRAISKQGLTVPTAVQSASIPKARGCMLHVHLAA
jgi:superfamily II DNA/RNA helicase